MTSNFVAGVDIGTHSVKAVIAENRGGRPLLRAAFKEPSGGVRRGAVVDVSEALHAVSRVVQEVKKISKQAARAVYASIGTAQVKMQPSRGIVAVSRADTEIYQDDVDKAVKASQAVNLSPNRTVIHNVTREFIVDGVGDIPDPLGLSGNRLEVNSLVIDAFSPHIKNLVKTVELSGGELGGLVLSPLVASRSALSKRQKELGTILVDIGAGTTGCCIYEENKLVGVSKFPLGGSHISNDLAVGLKIPVDAAEKLKLSHGHALSRDVSVKESVLLGEALDGATGSVSRRFIADIIESRLAEILDLVNNELKAHGRQGRLPGGVVLVGGGAKVPGLTDLARQVLKLSSQIGVSMQHEWESGGGQEEFLEDPEFVTACGLALWGMDDKGWKKGAARLGFKQIVRYFLP